jgi:hypothetical protein
MRLALFGQDARPHPRQRSIFPAEVVSVTRADYSVIIQFTDDKWGGTRKAGGLATTFLI